MLYFYSKLPDSLKDKYARKITTAFNALVQESVLIEPFVKEMVKDIDKSDVLYPNIINSPFIGYIPPEKLSKGVKALTVLYKNKWNLVLPTHLFGDNCSKWIVEIAKTQDVHLVVTSYLRLDFNVLNDINVCIDDTLYTKDSDSRDFMATYICVSANLLCGDD